ncbi:uncharacterized protein LOC107871341 [Capsicum annuum]|uniref:uncharacterized protein LOC107871341 n=1 Tax=Capsicum annuum TaxID=4072 RepID=UPI001FB077AB|nr:uncharacterized protein LOC107871341 [Capsicum annuum]
MSNLSKFEFVALDIFEKNYLSWVLDAEIHLATKGLSATITPNNAASSQDKTKAIIFLRHHLDEGLKVEYLIIKDPLELWTNLNGRIVSQLNYQQYHEKGFQKYSELISCLLVAEQHNVHLMKNHEARPTGAAPLPKANGAQAHGQPERRKDRGHNNIHGSENERRRYNNHRGGGNHKIENQMGPQNNPSRVNCHYCDMKDHWKDEFRAPKHFASIKNLSKEREMKVGPLQMTE